MHFSPFSLLQTCTMASTANKPEPSLSPLAVAGLAGLGGLGAIAYGSICLGLYHYQKKLIFRPLPQILHTPADVGIAYEDVWIPIKDKKNKPAGTLHGWWLPNPMASDPAASVGEAFLEQRRTLLFFHGNYGNVSYNLERIRYHHSLGFSVLAIDYRGYGQSLFAGTDESFPSEQSTYADAEATWQYLTTEHQLAPEKITVCGHSLGGAIAINLALQHPDMARLIIKSSFTTMKDAVHAKKLYRLIPVEQLLTETFDSLSKVKHLKVPVLYVHGAEDPDVPTEMSQQLYQASPEPKQFWIAPEADHNNITVLQGDRYRKVVTSFCNDLKQRPLQRSAC